MLDQSADRYRLHVHATPGARRTQVGGGHDGALRVAVTAPADKGKANQAIVKALAAALDIKRSQVELASGATNRRKTFWISEPPVDFASRVAKLAAIN